MSFTYVSVDEAIARKGLRMVVVGGVPSPWGEAAKGLFHIKGLDWVAVRLAYDDEKLPAWSGHRNAPVAVYDDEPPLAGWREILMLAERLAPQPALLPADPADREEVLEVSAQLIGEGGLAWTRRLQLVHAGLNGQPGFPPRVAGYLAKRYGHTPELGPAAGAKVVTLLGALAARLRAQHDAGRPYLIGSTLTAADVYAAAVTGLFAPLPQGDCPGIDPTTHAVFENRDAATAAALDPLIVAHRDRMYQRHLELPLCL